jgi:hypothetical protein
MTRIVKLNKLKALWLSPEEEKKERIKKEKEMRKNKIIKINKNKNG